MSVERPRKSSRGACDKKKASPRDGGQDSVPCIHESLGGKLFCSRKTSPIARPALDPPGAPDPVTGQKANSVEIPTHSEEIPGCQTGEPGPSRSVSQSNKYLKTGQGTRRPAGLAAGGERPRWLRGLERYFGRAEGGAWPEQNRRWMERERNRRVRRKLPSTPHTKKRKPGQAPAGPASAGPAGRTRARARADNGWECHVQIEWVEAQWLTPHCGGLSAGRGGGRAARQPRRSQKEVWHRIGL